MSEQKPKVTIFSDGACSGNGNNGVGGWAAVLLFGDREQELSGGKKDTTNNQMELTAVCEALEALPQPSRVTLYTDSQYVKKGITEWIHGWVKNGWVNSKREPVANKELWLRLLDARKRHDVEFQWVKGHAGNQHNERVDRLAVSEIAKLKGKPAPEPAKKAAVKPIPADATRVYITTSFESKTKSGGWGVIIATPNETKEFSGGMKNGSDYQAALTAAITALENAPAQTKIHVFIDNETVQKGASSWIKGWRANGWLNSKKEPVVHKDLWQRLDKVMENMTIEWKPAHLEAGRDELERSITLAKQARLKL